MTREFTKGMLSFLILTIVKKRKKSGAQIGRALAKAKGRSLSPGTIYPAIGRLRDEGLLRIKSEGNANYYWLSVKGKKTQAKAYRSFKKIVTNVKKYV